jgi:hypothetical protein
LIPGGIFKLPLDCMNLIQRMCPSRSKDAWPLNFWHLSAPRVQIAQAFLCGLMGDCIGEHHLRTGAPQRAASPFRVDLLFA